MASLIQTRKIKIINPVISSFLVEFLNECLKQGFFPNELKPAIITPLSAAFEKDQQTQLDTHQA